MKIDGNTEEAAFKYSKDCSSTEQKTDTQALAWKGLLKLVMQEKRPNILFNWVS